jgi:alginate O-acetyltransferase complex protein AlgI
MLFTGLPFFALFLPITLIGFFALARISVRLGLMFLSLASFVFYGVESPKHLPLLIGSIAFNFAIARRLSDPNMGDAARRRWLTLGVVGNLLVLAIFKYTGFVVQNINAIFNTSLTDPKIALPVGISFFTFTQTAFLVDHYKHRDANYDLTRYSLFVTYFPHLVAGPIIHHANVMPQLYDPGIAKPRGTLIALGFTILAIGLLKKVVFADGVGAYAEAVFNTADKGISFTMLEAWLGALAYTLQLYFDFSGYSDMAIGLSWMLGVRMPYNFNSPYKSLSITDFWRRWHMTLSAFLRDYLYIALGGNRKGPLRRYANLLTTMLLGGLWHGASWNFVIWGALHGIFLVINNGWRVLLGARHAALSNGVAYKVISWAITMFVVVHAWVFFRATTLSGALAVLKTMWFGGSQSAPVALLDRALDPSRGLILIGVLTLVAVFLPNSNAIGERLKSYLERQLDRWPYLLGFALVFCIALVVTNALRGEVSPFIYFNF